MMIQKSNEIFLANDKDNSSPELEKIVPEPFLAYNLDEDTDRKGNLQGIRYRFIIVVFIATAFLFGAVVTYAATMLINRGQAVKETQSQNSIENSSDTGIPTIAVDVHGDVMHPGVYHLSADSRVLDAIQAAGGYLHMDDSQFVNQAQPLVDGQEIVVTSVHSPNHAEIQVNQSGEVPPDSGSKQLQTAKIDLNTADESTLETVPGIGPKKASAIIEFRNSHGSFASVNDLKNVHGFGQSTLSKLVPYLFVQTNH